MGEDAGHPKPTPASGTNPVRVGRAQRIRPPRKIPLVSNGPMRKLPVTETTFQAISARERESKNLC